MVCRLIPSFPAEHQQIFEVGSKRSTAILGVPDLKTHLIGARCRWSRRLEARGAVPVPRLDCKSGSIASPLAENDMFFWIWKWQGFWTVGCPQRAFGLALTQQGFGGSAVQR